jgi:hypothetical protein
MAADRGMLITKTAGSSMHLHFQVKIIPAKAHYFQRSNSIPRIRVAPVKGWWNFGGWGRGRWAEDEMGESTDENRRAPALTAL